MQTYNAANFVPRAVSVELHETPNRDDSHRIDIARAVPCSRLQLQLIPQWAVARPLETAPHQSILSIFLCSAGCDIPMVLIDRLNSHAIRRSSKHLFVYLNTTCTMHFVTVSVIVNSTECGRTDDVVGAAVVRVAFAFFVATWLDDVASPATFGEVTFVDDAVVKLLSALVLPYNSITATATASI
jgi:hypothetical protein